MGASLKHKILTLALIFSASAALAGETDISATAGDCVQCALQASMNLPISNDKLPQRLPVGDTRQTITRTGATAEFNDVGIVVPQDDITIKNNDGSMRRGKFGATAGLINPCWALTNYHAVLGDAGALKDDPSTHKVTLYMGVGADGKSFSPSTSTTGTVKFAGDLPNDGYVEDYAIVNLDQCPGGESEIGYHDIATADANAMKGQTVTEVGYPNDISGSDFKTMKPVIQTCKILGYEPSTGNFQTSCRTTPGASGSMIYAESNGKKFVIAVARSGEAVYDAHRKITGYTTTAVSISHIVESIDGRYKTNVENKIAAYDQQYAPKSRPQDKGPAQIAAK